MERSNEDNSANFIESKETTAKLNDLVDLLKGLENYTYKYEVEQMSREFTFSAQYSEDLDGESLIIITEETSKLGHNQPKSHISISFNLKRVDDKWFVVSHNELKGIGGPNPFNIKLRLNLEHLNGYVDNLIREIKGNNE